MRRWIGGVVLLVLLTGCSLPAGTDGALIDDWPGMPEPKIWQPEAGTCSESGPDHFETVYLSSYAPVDCAGPHRLETIHVGTFTGEHANRDTQPPTGSPERRAAFTECSGRATGFLGADFRTVKVWLTATLPSNDAWRGGARWFRCDLSEYETDWFRRIAKLRSGSLRNSLKGDHSLGIGCSAVTFKDRKIDIMDPVACDRPHNAEFIGIVTAADLPYPKSQEQLWDVAGKRCGPVAASYAGLRDDTTLWRRISVVFQGFGEAEWNRGNRGVRCWLLAPRNVSRSMRGAGPGAFPVR